MKYLYPMLGLVLLLLCLWLDQASGPAAPASAMAMASSPSSEAASLSSTTSAAVSESAQRQSASASDRAQVELNQRIQTMQARRPGERFDPEQVRDALARDTAWREPDSDISADIPLSEEELYDGRQLIQFDRLKLETLLPGDTLDIEISDTGQRYTAIIERVQQHDYHSISWYGRIEGSDGQSYSVNFTQGENLTLGGLDTPDGNYQLQAHGDSGWIASSGALFKIPEDGSTDAIYPSDVTDHQH